MKTKPWQNCVLAVTGFSLLISMTACTSGPWDPTTRSTSEEVSPTSSSVPQSRSTIPSEPTPPVPESYEGDDFGVVVNGVRYIVEDSFYTGSLEFNVGSELYPEWQNIDVDEGSKFLVVDGIVVNESKEGIYPYAPITVGIQAEASDGAQYAMDSSSHATDTRVVPKLHVVPPHYETTVRYVYMVPEFLEIDHMAMTPSGRYTPDEIKRIEINP